MTMVVKDKFGRRRYIAFRIVSGDEITRKDLIYTFNRTLPSERNGGFIGQKPKGTPLSLPGHPGASNTKGSSDENEPPILKHRLKHYDGTYGILLCPHWWHKEAIETINSIAEVGILKKPVRIESIGTSGTLKKAMKKYIH